MDFEIKDGVLLRTNQRIRGELVIPAGVKELSKRAFFHNTIKSVVLPSTVEKIGEKAFANNRGLERAIIPETAKIGTDAFKNCGYLITNLSIRQWSNRYGIPKTDYTFAYTYYYQSGNQFFDSVKEENNKYIKRNLNRLLDDSGLDTSFVNYVIREIPLNIDQVEKMLKIFSCDIETAAVLLDYRRKNFSEEYLKKRAARQTEIELGLRPRTIADWRKIFALGDDKHGGYVIRKYLGKDTYVNIPDTIGRRKITAIGKAAFCPLKEDSKTVIENIQNIRAVYIPESVTKIGDEAFSSSNIEEMEIPSSVTSIGNHAFAYCKSLTSVTIPDSVTHIGHSAFLECEGLTEITLPGSLREMGFSVFADCANLTNAVISKGITAIPRTMFLHCRKLAEVQLPDGITELGNNAFSGCGALTHIILLDTITEIGNGAFEQSGITSIKIPSGVTAIREKTFWCCDNLDYVEIPASVTEIDPYAFYLAIERMVILAPRGSYAIEYAKEHYRKFKELPI